MDTTRENVERWIAEHAKPHITRDYRPADEARDMLRALLADRDRLHRELADEKKLSSAISRDCNNCANARNDATAERDTLKALCSELVLGCRYALDKSKLIELERRCKELGVRPFVQKESSSES